MIRITQTYLNQMISAPEANYPDECCGLFIGVNCRPHQYEVTHVVPCQNVHPSGAPDRFEVDPRIQFNLMREIRELGTQSSIPEKLVGHYHSHPDRTAKPSSHDLACAYEPNLIWVILGLVDRKVHQVAANKLCVKASQFRQIPLRQADGKAFAIAPDCII